MSDTLTTFRTNIRLDLADAATFWSNDQLDRGVKRAVADLSRFLPREMHQEYTLKFTVTDEHWTSAVAGTYVLLAYKPIQWDSEKVRSTDNATTYTRDTDYTMDYINGKITTIAGGGMSATGTFHASYTKSKIMIDISALTDLISVLDVEYPYGDVPQTTVSYGIFGSLLVIEGGEAEGQADMSAGDHIVMRYLATHTIPTADAGGSYPAFLDATVAQLAEAYLLFLMAYKYEQQAVTDFASARAALVIPNTALTGLHVLIQAALALADTQLDFAISVVPTTGQLTEVEVALDAVTSTLSTIATYLTGSSAPSTKAYLTSGAALINTVNVGDTVPDLYAIYAGRASELASALLTFANAYVNEATVRLGKSDRWLAASAAWIEQANSYLAEIDRYLGEADRYTYVASQNLALADKFRTDAIEKRNEVWTIWRDKSQYVGDLSSIALRQPTTQSK